MTPHTAAAVLLPDPATLHEEQQRGARRIWCVVSLSSESAHDFGPRTIDVHGSLVVWFPRSCRTCWKNHAPC